MDTIWTVVSIIALVVVIVIFLLTRSKVKGQPKVPHFVAIGILFVAFGIIFGDNRLIGYPCIGIGVIMAVIAAIKSKKK